MPGDRAAIEHIRADERMRIAQYLHDSALQKLALLQLTLGRMRREGGEGFVANIAECEKMVAEIGRHMRHIDDSGFQ
jgi:signal transduction histidine kinase